MTYGNQLPNCTTALPCPAIRMIVEASTPDSRVSLPLYGAAGAEQNGPRRWPTACRQLREPRAVADSGKQHAKEIEQTATIYRYNQLCRAISGGMAQKHLGAGIGLCGSLDRDPRLCLPVSATECRGGAVLQAHDAREQRRWHLHQQLMLPGSAKERERRSEFAVHPANCAETGSGTRSDGHSASFKGGCRASNRV
jgi:hypothetical protein